MALGPGRDRVPGGPVPDQLDDREEPVPAAHVADDIDSFLHGAQLGIQKRAQGAGTLDQLLVLVGLEGRQTDGAGQRDGRSR